MAWAGGVVEKAAAAGAGAKREMMDWVMGVGGRVTLLRGDWRKDAGRRNRWANMASVDIATVRRW